MCRVGVGEMDGIKAYIRFGKAGDRVYAFGPFNQRGQHTASGQAAIFRDRQSPLQVAARHRDDLTAIIAALGDKEQRDAVGRFYAYYTEDELSGLLRAAGLVILDCRIDQSRGLLGQMDKGLHMIAKRPA